MQPQSIPPQWTQYFDSRVSKTESCWLWKLCVSTDGYGRVRVGNTATGRHLTTTHRHSWTLCYGPIPDGLFVLHRCDVRACVRPDHLFVGTQADNMHDMIAKGREGARTHPERQIRGNAHWTRQHPEQIRGELNGRARLTAADVVAIRASDGGLERAHMERLAIRYAVSLSTIKHVLYRHTWKHLPNSPAIC